MVRLAAPATTSPPARPLPFVPASEIARVAGQAGPDRLPLIADMCRMNALAAIQAAGSGHIGASFSSMDLATYLYHEEMRLGQHPGDADRDIYISSKGHDAPGYYAVLVSAGLLDAAALFGLRRLGGLPGHPDVRVPGIAANTGSLGMGISKAKGHLLAKRLRGAAGRVFVLTGDGEFQEGQVFEAMQVARQHALNDLYVIIDHNKVQSDRLVDDIVSLGDLVAKGEAFGFAATRADGHDPAQLRAAFTRLGAAKDRPKLLVADTIKGRGVSFMEHPRALAAKPYYEFHAGAVTDDQFARAFGELHDRTNARLAVLGREPVRLSRVRVPAPPPVSGSTESITRAFGSAIGAAVRQRPDVVVFDADLSADCGLRDLEAAAPGRFVEHGIAEQDMVSTAGAVARAGFLPVINSFAAFLSARANEQIYNNATERSRLIYAFHYAGLLPAAAGHSHQSIRDIGLVAAIPGLTIIQPCNEAETAMAVEFCCSESAQTCVLRLAMGTIDEPVRLPDGYRLRPGHGVVLREGRDAVVLAYGPRLLAEAVKGCAELARGQVECRLVNMPWLNYVDPRWLAEVVADVRLVVVIEDHAPAGGLGDCLLRTAAEANLTRGLVVRVLGVEGIPECGMADEVLKYHGLDSSALAARIRGYVHRHDDELG